MSEKRLLGSDNLACDDYVLVWSGKVTEHQSGVAILMKKKFTTYKLTIEPISDRILKITLPIYNQGFTVIATYAPTNPHDIEDKMQFYEQLQKSIDNVPEKHCLYICGDLNARVGRSNTQENEWHGVVGNFGNGIRNENGLLLLEFCTNNNIKICNTFSKHKI